MYEPSYNLFALIMRGGKNLAVCEGTWSKAIDDTLIGKKVSIT